MKKYILLLLILFLPGALKAQLTDRLGVQTDHFLVEKSGIYDMIKFGTDYLTVPGKPELPVVVRSYVIPTDAVVSGLQVSTTNERKLGGTYYIWPAQLPQPTMINRQPEFTGPDSTYLSASPYPESGAVIASDKMVQGYRVVTVNFHPVSYLPITRELYIRDVSVTINYQRGNAIPEAPKNSYRRAMLAKEFVRSMVVNPEDVELYYDASAVIPQSTGSDSNTSDANSRALNAMQQIIPDYVIITNESLKASFKKLADWKTKKGIPTVIKTVEEINEVYAGSDLVEKIRNYLIDVEKRWNSIGLFVLIGGDINIVPARMVKGSENSTYPADCYFVCETSSWNPVSSAKWFDYNYNSYLGRIPVKNSTEADSFINKLLAYEKANSFRVDYSYFRNSLIIDAFTSFSKNENTGLVTYNSGKMNELYDYCKDLTSSLFFAIT